jgi:hypothetical protein
MVLEMIEGDSLYRWLNPAATATATATGVVHVKPKPSLEARCAALCDVARIMRSFEACKVVIIMLHSSHLSRRHHACTVPVMIIGTW